MQFEAKNWLAVICTIVKKHGMLDVYFFQWKAASLQTNKAYVRV